jgi:hypothetical protein
MSINNVERRKLAEARKRKEAREAEKAKQAPKKTPEEVKADANREHRSAS